MKKFISKIIAVSTMAGLLSACSCVFGSGSREKMPAIATMQSDFDTILGHINRRDTFFGSMRFPPPGRFRSEKESLLDQGWKIVRPSSEPQKLENALCLCGQLPELERHYLIKNATFERTGDRRPLDSFRRQQCALLEQLPLKSQVACILRILLSRAVECPSQLPDLPSGLRRARTEGIGRACVMHRPDYSQLWLLIETVTNKDLIVFTI